MDFLFNKVKFISKPLVVFLLLLIFVFGNNVNAVDDQAEIDALNAQMAQDNAALVEQARADREAEAASQARIQAIKDESARNAAARAQNVADAEAAAASTAAGATPTAAEGAAKTNNTAAEPAKTNTTSASPSAAAAQQPAAKSNASPEKKESSSESSIILRALSWIMYYIAAVAGKIFIFFLQFLIQVSQWNVFTKAKTVEIGWRIVRDFCNMFFIFILLLIAFGTILQRDDYNAKKLLPKLLIMAVMINFSKTICGLIIDFSQVIMLTFISAIGNGGNNLADLLGVDKMYKASKTTLSSDLATFTAISIAFLSTLVSLVVVWAFIFMMISRVIMLWVYIILSPLAYLLDAFPEGKKYSGKWWSEFSSNVIVGPVLAFFLWLALATAQGSSQALVKSSVGAPGADTGIISSFLANDAFSKAIITMGILLAGLKVAQSVGASVGGALGKASARISKGQAAITGFASRKAQDMTGISAVRQYASNWSAARKSARDDKINAQAMAITGGVGWVKKNTVGAAGKWASNKWNRYGNQADKVRNEANKYKKEVEMKLETMGDKADLDLGKFRKIKNGDGWLSTDAGDTKVYKADDIRAELTKETAKKLKTAEDLDTKQNKMDVIGKGATIALGAGLGALSGGLGLGSIATAGMGALFANGARGALASAKNVGNFESKNLNKHNSEMVNKKRAEMKDIEDDEVLNTMRNKRKSAAERAGALMEATSRGLKPGKEESQEIIGDIDKSLGGKKGATEFTNPALKSSYAAIAERHDKGATSQARKAMGGDAEAIFDTTQGFSSGAVSAKMFASTDLADIIAQGVTAGLSKGQLDKQYSDLDGGSKAAFAKGLEKALESGKLSAQDITKITQQLANISDGVKAFGKGKAQDNSDAQKWTQSVTKGDIMKWINDGENEKLEAFAEKIGGDLKNLSNTMQGVLMSNSQEAKMIAHQIGVAIKP